MFRKNLDPKVTAIVTVVVLGVVQYAYWRGLVYIEPGKPPAGGGPGPGPVMIPSAIGHEEVHVTTLAGGEPGFADGPGWAARFCGPNAVALSPDGSLFVSDSRNHRIRSVSPAGSVETVAGGGEPEGQGGRAEGTASEARFRFPSGLALAPDGRLFISDTGNHRICVLAEGKVSVLAGGAEGKADGRGNAARFRYPASLAFEDGALWVADTGNRAVRRVTLTGEVSSPQSLPARVSGRFGDLLAARWPSRDVLAPPDGRGAFETTQFRTGRLSPSAPAGPLQLFADTEFHTLLAKGEDGELRLLAGRYQEGVKVVGGLDGIGSRTSFALPCAIATSADGTTAFVADYEGHRIRRVSLPDWVVGGGAPAGSPDGARRIWRGR